MSKKYETVMKYYDGGYWTKKQVRDAVKKAWITETEYAEITGEAY